MNPSVWRKSSRSSTTGGDCVEVASLSTMIGVRDSKNPGAGHLTLSPERFAQLITAVKRGELHL
ncbi:DUF397 domain-containing protein [Actinomadura sp. BRA 177]|uniref:DUF397 domain-containing protein n=1 Tax=Actinomadura sp. BRA 177 TaxID=2745202 RepID=UPI0015962689|nr:DUF397 domain-containing protein [Actinomadura sp. BRA 177]NVI92994.1 DUF397 domain-containing protein [Actinomadura sp. BRA 177]